MNIKIRRVIMTLFFLAFLIIGPLLILYASGYRYDLKRGRILSTGNIFIEAKDIRSASVYLEDELYDEPLTRRLYIKNLLPGDYTVRVEKDETYTWEKDITVSPSLTSFIFDLVLFIKTEPVNILTQEVSNFVLSPDKKLAAYTLTALATDGSQEVLLLDLDSLDSTLLYRSSQTAPLKLSWSQTNDKLLITGENSAVITRTDPPFTATKINSNLTGSADFFWNDNEENEIFYSTGKSIVKNDLVKFQETELLKAGGGKIILSDLILDGDTIYFLENSADSTFLKLYNTKSRTTTEVTSLARSVDYEFLELGTDYLTLANKALNKVYLIRISPKESDPVLSEKVIIFDARKASLSHSKELLMLFSDSELKVFDLKTSQLNLINRFSKKIKDAIWYADDLHIIINIDDKLIITDLSASDQGILMTEILKGAAINMLALVNDDLLLLVGQVGEVEGLYSLKIK